MDLSGFEKYSYSKLSSFHTCPHSFMKRYINNEVGENNGFSIAGDVAHSIIEDYHKGNLSEYELYYEFEDRWDKAFENNKVTILTNNFKKDLTHIYKQQFTNYFATNTPNSEYNVIESETRFLFLLDSNIMFEGRIDCVAVDENEEYTIIDNKSKGKWANDKERKEYLRQLYLYSIYVKYKYGKYPSKLVFNQFRICSVDVEMFDMEAYEESLKWMCDTIESIKSDTSYLPKKDPFFCMNLCSYRNTCAYK